MAAKENNKDISVDSISGCEPDIETETDDGDYYITEFIVSGKTAIKFIGKSENAEIPYGVQYLNYDLFAGNKSVKRVVFPDSVLNIPVGNASPDWCTNIFKDCTELEEIVIGSGVTEIGDCTFAKLTNLKKVVIGDKVKKIGNYAFENCTSLTDITIPEGVEICSSAFNGCTSLTQIRMKRIKK